MSVATNSWLPDDFRHPGRVQLSGGRHLRPIRATDVDIDLVAVLGSQPRLWAKYGEVWGWPPVTLTAQQDYLDLDRHEREMARHESFNYALLNADETALFGCVYLDPPEARDHQGGRGVEVSWWVVDELAGTSAETELAAVVPAWLDRCWPFGEVSYPFGEVCYPFGEVPGPTIPAPPVGLFDHVRTPLPELDRDAAAAVWQDFRAALPAAAGGSPDPEVVAFGDSVELADELIGLVLRGVKTATASLLRDHSVDGGPDADVGDCWLACDGTGVPRVVLQTVELRVGPVETVDAGFAWAEGEDDRSRASWLESHTRYWERSCASRGEPFSLSDQAVFERFRVVWPPDAVARAAAFHLSVASRPARELS